MLNNDLIALIHTLADAAGNILRTAHRQPFTADRKADASPVTQTDREVETTIRSLIEKTYPDHGIIGEEFGNVRAQSPYQWVLDPIDGTRSFIGGYPLFTTLIALAYEGVPILGVIDQPILKERWVGIAGQKTTLNGNAVSTRTTKLLSGATLATTSVDYFAPEQTTHFLTLKKQCAYTVLGGDAYAYAMLASGQTDIVLDAGMKPYDFCALKPIIEGAGGVITDWEGKPLTIASDGKVIAAATAALHKEAISFLGQ